MKWQRDRGCQPYVIDRFILLMRDGILNSRTNDCLIVFLNVLTRMKFLFSANLAANLENFNSDDILTLVWAISAANILLRHIPTCSYQNITMRISKCSNQRTNLYYVSLLLSLRLQYYKAPRLADQGYLVINIGSTFVLTYWIAHRKTCKLNRNRLQK